jgi:hypothetical protein
MVLLVVLEKLPEGYHLFVKLSNYLQSILVGKQVLELGHIFENPSIL